jgi:hypothetical protein
LSIIYYISNLKLKRPTLKKKNKKPKNGINGTEAENTKIMIKTDSEKA